MWNSIRGSSSIWKFHGNRANTEDESTTQLCVENLHLGRKTPDIIGMMGTYLRQKYLSTFLGYEMPKYVGLGRMETVAGGDPAFPKQYQMSVQSSTVYTNLQHVKHSVSHPQSPAWQVFFIHC